MFYKVFKSDMTCRGFQFEVGKSYHQDGKIELCKNGFHFHSEVNDLFEYYDFDPTNIVCEIEASGEVIYGYDKSVCSDITIIRKLEWNEVLNLVNTGIGNTGLKNSGSFNSGDHNSGNYNSGFCNSGSDNSGHHNSGDYNSGSYNSGYCNSIDGRMMLFNNVLDMSVKEFWSKYNIPIYPQLIKQKGDKLIKYDYKEAWRKAWENSTPEKRDYMMNLPGFTKENFKEVTGIDI